MALFWEIKEPPVRRAMDAVWRELAGAGDRISISK